MLPAELVAAGESVFGKWWGLPLARAIGFHPRSVRFWRKGKRRIPEAAAQKIRKLAQLGPVGTIIRAAIKKTLPTVDPWSAHRVAQQALTDLAKAGLLEDEVPAETGASPPVPRRPVTRDAGGKKGVGSGATP